MIQIKLKSLSKESLGVYNLFIKKILNTLNISFKFINLPNKRKILTLLKSPHVNKSAREQFQIKSYTTSIIITSQISLERLKIIVLNKPKTVKINIKKIGE